MDDNRMPEILIEDGTLIYDNTFIQLCNISKITVDKMKREKIPPWMIYGTFISTCMLFSEKLATYGVLGVIACLIPIICIMYSNSNLDDYIVISLNCGETVCFFSENRAFLDIALKKMIDSIKDGKRAVISFNNCTIDGGNFTGGNTFNGGNNGVINTGNNSKYGDAIVNNGNNNVNTLENDWAEAINLLSV